MISIRPLRRRTARLSSEEGFTLIEMMITIVILSLITGTLGAVFMTAMRATANNSQTVHASNDAQLIAAYLVRDGQSAGGTNAFTGLIDSSLGVSVNWITQSGGSDPDPAVCSQPAPDQLLIRFAWRDYVSSATSQKHLAKYYYVPPTGNAAGQVVRVTCVDSVQESSQMLGTHVGASTPTATCVPSAGCPGVPDLVQLTVTETANTLTPTTPYTYTLTAHIRASNDVPGSLGSGSAASVPVLALGGSVCVNPGGTSGFGDGGSSTTKVYGGVAVDNGGAVGCPAINFFGNSYTYTAAGQPQVLNLPDPYASLAPPSQPCTPGVGSNPGPVGGVYPGGVYPQPLPANAVLASGGIFVICNTVPTGLTGSGVLLYLEQGASLNWNGNSTTTLTAASTGPYAGIAIWQDKTNTTPLVVNGGAALNLNLAAAGMGSGIYAPSAPVELIGTADVSIGWVVAQAVIISGNHKVTIGVPPDTLPSITAPASLPVGLVGQSYPSTQVTATGGSGGNLWTGTGLDGLVIDPNTGIISGTPTTAGNFTATITVTDNFGDVSQRAYPLTINAKPTISSVSVIRSGNAQVTQGAHNATVTINGSGFQSNATVAISGPPSDISIVTPLTITATSITFNINVSQTATPGLRDVTVTNPTDGGTITSSGALTVRTPPPSISSVALQNSSGPNNGSIQQGDTITVVFSSQMSVSSFCSGWTTDTNNQSLAASDNVVVTVTHGTGGANDALTVSGVKASSCASGFNFGTLDLGSNAYVTGTVTFGATGTATTINWNAASNTLTIKLGNQGGAGTVNTVASSSPVYTAGSVTDSWAGPLVPATFSVTPGQQF